MWLLTLMKWQVTLGNFPQNLGDMQDGPGRWDVNSSATSACHLTVIQPTQGCCCSSSQLSHTVYVYTGQQLSFVQSECGPRAAAQQRESSHPADRSLQD